MQPVFHPFLIGAEIGDRRFDLDDQNFPIAAERDQIGAAPTGGGAGKRLTLIVRIPGSGTTDENRASILRISRHPTFRRTILS